MKNIPMLIFIILFLLSTQAMTQETETNGVHCGVGFIQFNDGTPSSLTVRLVVTGGIAGENQGMRDLVVLKAIDSSGRDILLKHQPELGVIAEYSQNMDDEKFFDLSEPSEKATSIRELSGEILVHIPSKDPKAKIVLPNFVKKLGNTIESQELNDAGIQLSVSTLGKLRPNPPKIMNSALIQPEVKDDDYAIWGMDPTRKLVGVEIFDGNGKRISCFNRGTSWDDNEIGYELRCETPAGPDAQLVLYLDTEKSIVKVPFKLKNLEFSR
jgi:hypothetical protein